MGIADDVRCENLSEEPLHVFTVDPTPQIGVSQVYRGKARLTLMGSTVTLKRCPGWQVWRQGNWHPVSRLSNASLQQETPLEGPDEFGIYSIQFPEFALYIFPEGCSPLVCINRRGGLRWESSGAGMFSRRGRHPVQRVRL
jgi:hypothetical protein